MGENLNEKKVDEALNKYTLLSLAYLGDAVFELHIRDKILSNNINTKPSKLHILTRDYVKASAQAELYHILVAHLDEAEADVMKRGRNAKPPSSSRSSSVSDYRHATGVETLFGYLHVKNANERIIQLIEICFNELQ